MGLWSDLFQRTARGDGAVLSTGRVFAEGGEPPFPNLGVTRLVGSGELFSLKAVIGSGKPCVVELYSNCCCGDTTNRNMEALAREHGGAAEFVAVCFNGLVANPPSWHPEAGLRGKKWPRAMAAELEARVGGMTSLTHLYAEVDDGGEHIVGTLGLCTVPTHVLVGTSGQVLAVLQSGQLPTQANIKWLLEGGPRRVP